MRKTQTIHSGAFVSDARERLAIGISPYVLFVLLLAGFMFTQPVLAVSAQGVQEIAVDNADIRSPKTTLASLFRLTDAFHELVREDGFTRENEVRVRNILQQMEKLFDLRQIPPKYQRNVAAETAVYLHEALARFPVPSIEEIPDDDGMATRIKDGKAALYRLPGTPVVISKTDMGTYEGRYQFSAATVTEAKNWYESAKPYPYIERQDYITGLYEEYFLTPGPLIPVE